MEDNKKGGLPPNNPGCRRMSAKNVLLDKIKRCQKELEALTTLDASIRWDLLDPQQEELLWHYFITNR